SNHSLTPAVAINGVKRPDAKHIVREIGQKLDRGQPPKFVMRTQQRERADRVRTPQLEFFSLILRQGFRNKEVAPEPIRQTKGGCNPKRETWIDVARQSANCRSE